MMKDNIYLESHYLEQVKRILQKNLPAHARIWVFGSRVTGKFKKFSDLDIAINVGQPISIETMANLKNSFDESDLPYKVDIVDWFSINKSFQDKINKNKIELLLF